MNKMPAWKQDFLEADFHYFQADCKFEVCQALAKISGNRSLASRIFRLIKRRSAMVNATLDSFLASLEILKEYKVFQYSIQHEKNKSSTVYLEVNDEYFDAVQMIKKSNPLLQIGYSKKKFVQHLEKNLRKTYTQDLTMIEENGDGGQ